MTLHRRLRGITPLLYTSYDSIRTVGKNRRHASLKTHTTFPGEEWWIHEEILPAQIRLRAQLKALPIPLESSTQAVFCPQGKEAPRSQVYEKKFKEFQHAAVQLVYDSFGSYRCGEQEWREFEGNSLGEMEIAFEGEDYLYHHPFLFQTGAVLKVETELKEKGWVKVTPPGEIDGYPLWAYGGIFRPGCKAEDIEQAVFTITGDKERTLVKISSLSQWRAKGLLLPHSKKIGKLLVAPQDKDFSAAHNMNLKEAIEGGRARCLVSLGRDSREGDIIQDYESCAIEKDLGEDKFIITFKKRI